MKQLFEEVYDRLAGYALLCWICRRPVLAKPPRFSWLLDVFVADSDELQNYLRDLCVTSRQDHDAKDGEPIPYPRKFSEIVEFNRSRDVHRKR
jgi:hypothetical protein